MKLTHATYETSVQNPECAPEEYNPATPLHNAPGWLAAVGRRESYEEICALCGVDAQSDAEIRSRAYALHHQEFSREQWLALSREERVRFKLGQRRLEGMESEDAPTDEQRTEAFARAQQAIAEAEAMEAEDGDGYGL